MRPPGRDHPRIRGEHTQWGSSAVGVSGSSPHTRGARFCAPPRLQPHGIIPAYAGSTRTRRRPRRSRADHPRIRGEHAVDRGVRRRIRGSSPHTRGARRPPISRIAPVGIIPAYAGSTSVCRTKRMLSWDHPRIRGEHARDPEGRLLKRGSSPHTRGARPPGASARSGRRIIPAYAGSTPMVSVSISFSADHPRIRGEHSRSLGRPP